MSSHAPIQARAERPVVYELTVVWAAAAGPDSPRRKTFTLDRSLRIGADSANHIVVDGEGVGAFHARFFPGPVAPTLVLSDSVASINGLEVSGSAGLIPGDVLSVGDCEVRVSVRGARQDSSAGTAAQWQLISEDGDASVQIAGDVIIGSDAGCGIRLPDDDIAARHVQLVPREGALWVRDFSDGATFVNDDAVRGACRLEPDDMLRLGQHRFHAARQTVVTVEPATTTPVTTEPTPANSFSLRSHVTAAIDLPTAQDAPRAVFRPVKPAPEQPPPEKVPPVALEVKAPPVKPAAENAPPEKPVLEKSSLQESPPVNPPPMEMPRVKASATKPPAAKPRLERPAPEQPPLERPPQMQPSAAKPPADKPRPMKPTPAAGDAIWELDSLEMPAINPHFELLDSEEPKVAVAPVVPETFPPRASPRTGPKATAATERPVVSIRVVPVSTQQLARRRNERTTGRTTRRTAGRTAGSTTRWWVLGLLLLILTLVWAVAMRPPGYDGSAPTDALDRSVAAARTLQTSIVERWRVMLANRARTASESAATASVPATDGVPAPNADAIETDGVAQPTPEIIELQRNAAAGDAAAIARLKELGDFYAALASSAMDRGDREAAQRHLAMVVLMRPITPKVAESAPAAPATPEAPSRQRPVSRADALVQEARQLQARGAVVSPARRNAVVVLVAALTLDPNHEGARRQLNQAIGSLNGRIDTLIANHQFRAAGALLAQLADDGIPVLSNGNVRDRPEFLEARSWQPLAVSSLLVEADALIQQGSIATPGDDNAISRLESATRIDPGNPLIEDMRAKISGMLFLAAKDASERGMREEARRLTNLANYTRDGFGA